MQGTFRSLRNFNYRVWASGAIVSNVGTWMQRIAQDWIVLTELTNHNATAVGIVMSLQFAPAVLLLPLTGYAADHMDRRKLLFLTQVGMGLFALGLGILTILKIVKLWHVYAFAFLLGCVAAFDAPARQTFVSDLVGEEDLANAVALNSTSFNGARMIGPAVAGLLIARVGSGWVFIINAISFGAVLISLLLIRGTELHHGRPASRGGLADGFRYVRARGDLMVIFVMLFLVATFGLNFPIFIAKMAVDVFGLGAGQFGLLTSMLAVGSVIGALLAARRPAPYIGLLVASSAAFGAGCVLASVMPTTILFGITLLMIGISAQTFTTSTNSLVQLSTEPAMRGRVIAILLALMMGTTPLGAPLVGWIADAYGARWSLLIGAVAGFAAALAGFLYLRAGHAERVAQRGSIQVDEKADIPSGPL